MCNLHFLRVALCKHCALAATAANYTESGPNIDIFSKIIHYNLFNYCHGARNNGK